MFFSSHSYHCLLSSVAHRRLLSSVTHVASNMDPDQTGKLCLGLVPGMQTFAYPILFIRLDKNLKFHGLACLMHGVLFITMLMVCSFRD